MTQATETLKKSRNINIRISLDADALVKAMQDDPEEVDSVGEGPAVKMLRTMRDEQSPVVKLSQVPMAG